MATLPTSLFDEQWYLSRNPDVAEAIAQGLISPALEHFQRYGKYEGRAAGPLFNTEDYLKANPDVAHAAEAGTISPFTHLLTYGTGEGRDLGNGITLSMFANDGKFGEALANGNLQAALERVNAVAPFLPTFEPPAGWQPPANTPIPVDFTPPEGIKLVIPPGVNVPPDIELPSDIFEPVTPQPQPQPTPQPQPQPEPGGGSGGGGSGGGGNNGDDTPAFIVTNTGGTVTFANGSGDIAVTWQGCHHHHQ